MSQPKLFITGGAGFIGQAVARHFLSKGFRVRTYDLYDPPRIVGEHYQGTIMFPEDLEKAMAGYDYVVHLAAMLGVRHTEENRQRTLDVNITGTKNVLNACVKTKVKKVLFSSSSEVYGEPDKTPISEEDPVHPKSVYAVSKLAAEEYLRAFHKEYGLNYSIVRFFNIYGVGQVAEFVVPRFIKAVLENMPPTVHGDGSQIRAFCHVDDAADGLYRALMSPEANGHIFNIGNDSPTTIKSLAETIIAAAGSNLRPVFLDTENWDRMEKREIIKRIPDISKARKILGYNPVVRLEEGIKRILNADVLPSSWLVSIADRNPEV